MMRAAVVEAPGRLSIRELEIPAPGPYQALCRIRYGATCTGTDTHIIEDNFPFSGPLPTVLGHESVGEVVELGAAVRNYRKGDLVTRVGMPPDGTAGVSVTWGGFAEYGIAWDHWAMRADGMAASEWRSHRVNQIVPRGVDPETAPMFTTWRETRSYLRRLALPAGSRALIIGSGGNAFSFAVHALLLGMETVMVGSESRRGLAERAGVTTFVDYRSEDQIAELRDSGFEQVDLILDAVGRNGAVDEVLPLLAPDGTIAIYGIDDFGRITINPMGSGSSLRIYNGGYDEAETHGEVSELCLAGALDAGLFYDEESTFGLSDIAAAFDALAGRLSLKALIDLGEAEETS